MTKPAPANHPWRSFSTKADKLKAARQEAKRRYERLNPARNDEYRKLKCEQRRLIRLGRLEDAAKEPEQRPGVGRPKKVDI